MVSLLFEVVSFFWDAARFYAETEEGHNHLEEILTQVEADGFDIPFWEPQEDNSQNEGQNSDVEINGVKSVRPGQGA